MRENKPSVGCGYSSNHMMLTQMLNNEMKQNKNEHNPMK